MRDKRDAVACVANWVRILGLREAGDLLTRAWPVWDLGYGALAYVHGKPLLMTSSLMGVFDASDRQDVANMPEVGADLEPYRLNAETHPRWAHRGKWSLAFLGELDEPEPFVPLSEADLLVIPSGRDAVNLLLCAIEATRHAQTKAVRILDDGRILRIEAALPRSLGYERDDHSWIPKRWFEPLTAGPLESGFDRVVTANGDTALLKWTRLRNGPSNSYWTRLWPEEPTDEQQVTRTHAFGPVDDATAPILFGEEPDLPALPDDIQPGHFGRLLSRRRN